MIKIRQDQYKQAKQANLGILHPSRAGFFNWSNIIDSTTQNLDFNLLIPYMIEEILEPASFRLWQMTSPTSIRRFACPGPERAWGAKLRQEKFEFCLRTSKNQKKALSLSDWSNTLHLPAWLSYLSARWFLLC